MKIKKEDHKKIMLGIGALALILMVVFVFGKMKGRDENDNKQVDVTVNIKDENGQTIAYDPNDLLKRLNKGLTTTYYWNFDERCNVVKELYNLDAVRFMAAVRAYKVKYNVSLETHLKACYYDCDTGVYNENYSELIYQRIENLKDLVK
jgi:hypothetical protein